MVLKRGAFTSTFMKYYDTIMVLDNTLLIRYLQDAVRAVRYGYAISLQHAVSPSWCGVVHNWCYNVVHMEPLRYP